MSQAKPRILIVAAGPCGLTLALCLLQNDVPVRIIDKQKTYRIGRKGWGIQPRLLEVPKFLGTFDDLTLYGKKSSPLGVYQGKKEVLRTTFGLAFEPTPTLPWGAWVPVGQDRHEDVLRAHLAKYGCSVETSTELVFYEQSDDRVVAHLRKTLADGQVDTEDATFNWLVGTNGAQSFVRKTGGFSYMGETKRDFPLAVGDIIINKGLDQNENVIHVWGSDEVTIFMSPSEVPNTGLFTYTVIGSGIDCKKIAEDRDEWVKCFYKHTGRTDIEFGKFTWSNFWTPNIRMADTFQKGCVFLAGDAAHCHTPAGGQGLNTGVHDAVNLGWKLALVEKGIANRSLLDSYTAERLPVIETMLGKSTKLYDYLFATRFDDPSRWNRGTELLQLGVNYRSSPIIVDEFGPGTKPHDPLVYDPYGTGTGVVEGAKLHAGDRAPQAPDLVSADGVTTLFDEFKVTHHTVLVLTKSPESRQFVTDLLEKYPAGLFRVLFVLPKDSIAKAISNVVIDSKGYAYGAYTAAGEERIVVVRPDGWVGALVYDEKGLERYISRLVKKTA